jgi:hypothetical protein
MIPALLELIIAPCLAALSTTAARHWGMRVGGVVSAFPAIVGPMLLIAALDHGAAFTARTADGTLLGLSALAAFVLAYGRAARAVGSGASIAAGYAAAVLAGLAATEVPPGAGLPVAAASLAAAWWALPRVSVEALPDVQLRRFDIPARMILTAILVTGLSAAANALGAVAGGMLAALPALATVLVILTHRTHGSAAAIGLLRGLVAGMAGFVVFCEIVAALVVSDGIAVAFGMATIAALILQAMVALAPRLAATFGSPM